MLYPLIIETIAAQHDEEIRRRAERAVRVREARARTRAEARRARENRGTRRHPRLVTLRVAGLAIRSPR